MEEKILTYVEYVKKLNELKNLPRYTSPQVYEEKRVKLVELNKKYVKQYNHDYIAITGEKQKKEKLAKELSYLRILGYGSEIESYLKIQEEIEVFTQQQITELQGLYIDVIENKENNKKMKIKTVSECDWKY